MRTLVLALIFFIVESPKGREVFLDNELRDARFKGLVKIISYKTGTITFHPVDHEDSIKTSTTRTVDARIEPKLKDNQEPSTGYWPSAGQTIYIVIDKENSVSLFAKSDIDDYRFWNPYNMFNSTMFVFSPPTRKLKDETKFGLVNPEGTCLEVCLLKKDLVGYYDTK
jgi:hypothetical protein